MKKINFLGIPFDVIEDDEDVRSIADNDRPKVYVLQREADYVPDPSWPELTARNRRRLCPRCGEMCMIDPVSFAPVRDLDPEIMCQPCYEQLRATVDTAFHPTLTPGSREAVYRINTYLANKPLH